MAFPPRQHIPQGHTAIQSYATMHGDTYPADLETAGLSSSDSTIFEYSVDNSLNPRTFCLTVTVSTASFYVSSEIASPTSGTCEGHIGNNGDTWFTNPAQVAKLTAGDAATDDYFGATVSISGDTAVIGAYKSGSDSGSAYILSKRLITNNTISLGTA